eukprot:scaffold1850_cov170-Amphora_coffeaeformis.AAC.5
MSSSSSPRRNNKYDGLSALEWEERYFKDRFLELVEFKADHGHTDVPRDGSILGLWAVAQRSQYKNKELPPRRIKVLAAIGFNFNPNEDVMALEQRYFQSQIYDLVVYRAQHGNCQVPKDGSRLSRWIGSLRTQFKRGEVSEDRVKLLNSLDFEWKRTQTLVPKKKKNHPYSDVVNDTTPTHQVGEGGDPPRRAPRDLGGVRAVAYAEKIVQKWEEKFQQLVKYKEEHGTKQRVQYHYRNAGKKSSMTDERIAKLEGIGFAWVAPGFHQKGERPGRKRNRTDEELSGGEEGMTEDDLADDTGVLGLSDDDGAVANVARAPFYLNQPSPHAYHQHFYP